MPMATERWEARNETEQPSDGRMGRRLFLRATLAAAMAMASIDACAQDVRRSINKHLSGIPATTPHLDSSRSLLHENPRHGLIYIRQIHWAQGMDQRSAEAVERCQRQIKDMLEFLVDEGWSDDVYAEGRMAENEPPPDERYAYYEDAEEQGIDVDPIAERGGVQMVSTKKSFTIKGAERTAAYDRSGKVMNDPPSAERDRALFEERENALLEIIAEEGDDIATTVYGAAHDWENNVREWNKAHPDKAFSLITLTPREVAAHDRRWGRRLPPPRPEPVDPFTVPVEAPGPEPRRYDIAYEEPVPPAPGKR